MYADDIILLHDNVLELQKKITPLEKFCDEWSMEVNLTKTQVIAFRNVGKTCKSERFSYKSIQIVTYYRYFKKYVVESMSNLNYTSRKDFEFHTDNDLEAWTIKYKHGFQDF